MSRALVKIKSGRAEVCPASEVLPAKEARSSGAPAEAGGSQSDESRRFFAVLRENKKVKIKSGRDEVARARVKIKSGRAEVCPALVNINSGRAEACPLLIFTSDRAHLGTSTFNIHQC